MFPIKIHLVSPSCGTRKSTMDQISQTFFHLQPGEKGREEITHRKLALPNGLKCCGNRSLRLTSHWAQRNAQVNGSQNRAL